MYARMYVCIYVYYVCMHNISGELSGEKCPTQNGKGIVLREFPGVNCPGELSGLIVLHPTCLSVRPSDHPSIKPSLCMSICLSLSTYVRPSVYLSIHHSIHPSIHPSIHTSIHPFVCLSIYLSIYARWLKKSKLNCLCHICRKPNHRLKFRRYLHNSMRNVIPTHHNILSNR